MATKRRASLLIILLLILGSLAFAMAAELSRLRLLIGALHADLGKTMSWSDHRELLTAGHGRLVANSSSFSSHRIKERDVVGWFTSSDHELKLDLQAGVAFAKEKLFYSELAPASPGKAYYIQAEFQRISGPEKIHGCLVPRENWFFCLSGNRYWFGSYSLETLRGGTPTSAVHAETPDRLAIIAKGSTAYLFINGAKVDEVPGWSSESERAGIAIAFARDGHAVFVVRGFEVRTLDR